MTREEVRERLWPDRSDIKFESNVNTTVNKLRAALRTYSDEDLCIETVPRRGYSLILKPSQVPKENPRAATLLRFIVLPLAGMLFGMIVTSLWLFTHHQ